jgi:O-antigen/teichoic acid export membrane protein
MTDEPHATGLAHRTVRGMYWAYGSFVGLRLMTLLATAVLTRLLVPKDFGIVAIATTVMTFLEVFQGLGISQALVIAPEDELADRTDAAFTLSVSVGMALMLLTAALGPAAAAFFHQPQLVAIMPALGSTFLILSLSSTHYALAMRGIDFRSRTTAELVDGFVRGATGITLALLGAGVWSLVTGYIAGNLAMVAALWLLVPWRPRHLGSRQYIGGILRFGGYMTGVGVMSAFLTQFDNLVVGRVLGSEQLGFYSIATSIPGLAIINIAVVAGQVLFPAFAKLDTQTLRRGVITSFSYIAAVVFPLTAFLIVLAEPITIAVFGPHWYGAVDAVRVLCLWAAMSPISMVCGNAFMSRGNARLIFFLAIPQAIALVAGSLAVAPYGIVAVSWVQAAIAILAQAATLWLAQRKFGLPARSLLTAFLPPLLAALGLAGVLLAVIQLVTARWPEIIVGGICGGVAYLALLRLLTPELLPSILRLALARRGGARV